MLKVEEFIRSTSPAGMAVWLGRFEADEYVGKAISGGDCPLAHFARDLGYGRVHVTRTHVRDDETDGAGLGDGIELPDWMQQFVSRVDGIPWRLEDRYMVTAERARECLAKVIREQTIRTTYKQAEVVDALLREANGAGFWLTPLDQERVEATMQRCRELLGSCHDKDSKVKRGKQPVLIAASWHMNMLRNFQLRLIDLRRTAPGYRRLIAYEAASLEHACLFMSAATDPKHLEFWLGEARLFGEIWLAASEALLQAE